MEPVTTRAAGAGVFVYPTFANAASATHENRRRPEKSLNNKTENRGENITKSQPESSHDEDSLDVISLVLVACCPPKCLLTEEGA